MGVEFCLFKPETYERYELGKGNWYFVFPEMSDTIESKPFYIYEIFNTYSLYRKLLCEIATGFDKHMTLEYFQLLSESIVNWCKSDIIEFWREDDSFNEFYDPRFMTISEFMEKYPYTGSRFFSLEREM